jgi:hypothetical protein
MGEPFMLQRSGAIQNLPKVDTIHDTVRVVDDQRYIELLEKTNEQLNILWTPLNVLFAAMGVLFAAGAIIAAFLLYRQSEEHRRQIHSFLEDAQKLLNRKMADSDQQLRVNITEANSQLDAMIQSASIELTNLRQEIMTASGERRELMQMKEQLQEHLIQSLKEQKGLNEAAALADGDAAPSMTPMSDRSGSRLRLNDSRGHNERTVRRTVLQPNPVGIVVQGSMEEAERLAEQLKQMVVATGWQTTWDAIGPYIEFQPAARISASAIYGIARNAGVKIRQIKGSDRMII